MEALKAGLAAGADAFYLGLKNLNARNGAKNFLPAELREAVQLAHSQNARIYLTLNTALAQRELGLAARSLALAEQCGVDGILISDPALLAMKPYFPKLVFHFSTQAGVSSSAGVLAAKSMGISRAVLARELSFEEIRAATAIAGMETEVFIQGALCFSCSGRCLLSSWGGGRSGNRGSCTSPCRVSWTNAAGIEARPMSMRDLSLTDWVDALADIGVASLKIEGRLKSASWVSKAVTLYRQTLDHTAPAENIREKALSLGDYTGRDLTDGYLRGDRDNLTAVSGRIATSYQSPCSTEEIPAPEEASPLTIAVSEDERHATIWQFSKGDCAESFRTPPQHIANPKRASSVKEAVVAMQTTVKSPLQCNLPDALADKPLPRSAIKSAVEAFGAFLRTLAKEDDGMPRGLELPQELKAMLTRAPSPCPVNQHCLGDAPTRARLAWNQRIALPNTLTRIFECNPQSFDDAELQAETVLALPGSIASLPQVIYEYQIAPIRHLLSKLVPAGHTIEVNSWDTWQIATECGAALEAGPGLAVLNTLAARQLFQLGCRLISVSQEIDKNQLQDLCASAEYPLAITVFSRPALMTTRAKLPPLFDNAEMTDSRNTTLQPEHSCELTILRPAHPMDWRRLRNPAIKAAELILDLNGFRELPPFAPHPFLFNYDRRLR